MIAPVLLYHTVLAPPEGVGDRERSLFLSPERFADQLNDLAKRGFHSISLDEYAADLDRGFPTRSVLITFDDAYDHVADVATPMLRQHGFSAVMFAPLGSLGSSNVWDAAWSQYLANLPVATPERLRRLDPDVWEVASHGLWHIDLRTVASAELRMALNTAREHLGQILGRPIMDMAYPFGAHDHRVRRDVERAGYRMAFAAANGATGDRYQLPRWPISGADSLDVFRLKTSAWSFTLYRAYDFTPAWVRRPARDLLRRRTVQDQ